MSYEFELLCALQDGVEEPLIYCFDIVHKDWLKFCILKKALNCCFGLLFDYVF